MQHSAFTASFEHLPPTLAVFPLPGAVLMPGNDLPLNIFEPRYLNMVSDALSTHRMIGMIQPRPGDDERLFDTGCAGRITQYRETRDGRIEMILSGVCRFDIAKELPTTRGYRLVVPEWTRFGLDYDQEAEIDAASKDRLSATLKDYLALKALDTEWSVLEALSAQKLTDTLIMALPLSVEDKQALIEILEPAERLAKLVTVLGLELASPPSMLKH